MDVHEARAVSAERIATAGQRLRDAVGRYDLEEMARLLRDAVPEFMPAEVVPAPAAATDGAIVVAFPARNVRNP